MSVNWKAANNSKQLAQRGCVSDGGASASVSSAARRSDSALQPAETERKHSPLQILQLWTLNE